MKYTPGIILAIVFVFQSFVSNAQCEFISLGPDDKNQPSYYAADYPHMAIDGNDVVYVVFSDEVVNHNITVRKYEFDVWTTVGSEGFSTGETKHNKIAIDNNNTPYVAFRDESNGGKATVMKFDGTNWVVVGVVGFSAGSIDYTSLAIDGNGVPYLAYQDEGNDYKATVMKFDGNDWVIVGNAGFSADTASFISLAINSNNIPYLAYKDADNNDKATVMQYNGIIWTSVGSVGITSGAANYISLAISNTDTLYVAYQDVVNSSKASVMKFNGTNWGLVGNAGFSPGVLHNISITVGNNEEIFVGAYNAGINYNKVIVSTFNGLNWEDLNPEYMMDFKATNITILLDGSNIPTVAFNYSHYTKKVLVYKWNNNQSWSILGNYHGVLNEKHNFSDNMSMVINDFGIPFLITRKDNYVFVLKYVEGEWLKIDTMYLPGYFGSVKATIHNNELYFVAHTNIGSSLFAVYKLNIFNKIEIFTPIANDMSILFDFEILFSENNDIYVLYHIDNWNSTIGVKGQKFNGNSWTNLGVLGTTKYTFEHIISHTNLALDKNNNIYTAFENHVEDNKVSIVKHNGTNLSYIGSSTISIDSVAFSYIAIDKNDTLYLAYSDLANDGKLSVFKFDGTDWIPIGNQGISEGRAEHITLKISDDGTPYVLFSDWGNDGKAILLKFDDTNWIPVFISTEISIGNNLIFSNNGSPILGYNSYYGFSFSRTLDEYLAPDFAEQTQIVQYPYSAYFKDDCEIIATLKTTNNNSVTGNTTAKVWVENTQPTDFVKRHYEIYPANNAATSSGRAIFYFKQSEFDDYNAVSVLKLPANANDSVGIKNLAFIKYSGNSNNNTGLPNSYTGDSAIIYPNLNNIIWNGTDKRWEITLDIVGFGGFFLKVIDTTTSINGTISTIEKIELYPNPTEHTLNISVQQNSELLNTQVSISTVLGAEIQKVNLSKTHTQIHLAHLSSGVYFIRFANGAVEKFVKQ